MSIHDDEERGGAEDDDYDEESSLLPSRTAMNNDTSYLNSFTSSSRILNNDTTEILHQANSNGISWYFAVFLIVNAALGAGLLNFAKAFDNAGGIFISSIIHCV